MDEAVGMQAFNRGTRMERTGMISAGRSGCSDGQEWPEALAGAEHGIAHRLNQFPFFAKRRRVWEKFCQQLIGVTRDFSECGLERATHWVSANASSLGKPRAPPKGRRGIRVRGAFDPSESQMQSTRCTLFNIKRRR